MAKKNARNGNGGLVRQVWGGLRADPYLRDNMVNGILQKNEIKNNSVQVTDIESQVLRHIEKMASFCTRKIGIHPGGVAIAHCQVERDNPLKFFVFADGECIVNPLILAVDEFSRFRHKEGCLSLAYRPEKRVIRWDRIRVEYTQIKNGEIKVFSEWITGLRACVFQHEIDHFKRVYV